MTNNFKAFEFGLRIAPGLSADPIEGKIGEIYWNTTRNILRICTATTPIWQDLFISDGTVNDASVRWDAASGKFQQNTGVLISSSTIYSPAGTTGSDLNLQSGLSTNAGVDGGDILLKTGLGGSGADQGHILLDSLMVRSIDNSTAKSLSLMAGTTTTSGNDGGDLTLSAGDGSFVAGDKESSTITCRADVNGDLTNKYFELYAPGSEYYVWFNSNNVGVAQDITVTIVNDGSSLVTGSTGLYWTVSDPNGDYYVWYNAGTESDPNVAGMTGIEVTVTPLDSVSDVLTKTVTLLDSAGFWTNTAGISDIQMVCNTVGSASQPTAGTSAQTFVTNTYGVDISSDPGIAGKNGIQVPFDLNDTDADIASSMITALVAYPDFASVSGTNPEDVVVTNNNTGNVSDASDGNVGGAFAIVVDTQGTDDTGLDGDVYVEAKERIDLDADRVGIKAVALRDPLDTISEIGDIYYNSIYKRFRKFDGTSWKWIEFSETHVPICLVNYKDDTLTELPETTAETVDGAVVSDGDLVLFTNLLIGANKIYKASVIGVNIAWSVSVGGQNDVGDPADGDFAYVKDGGSNGGLTFSYTGAYWVSVGGSIVEQTNQDRGMQLTKGGVKVFTTTTNTLSWSQNAYIEIPGLAQNRNTILANSVVMANNDDVAYVTINRNIGVAANLTVSVDTLDNIDTNPETGKNIIIIAKRVDDEIYWGLGGSEESILSSGVYKEQTFSDNNTAMFDAWDAVNSHDARIYTYSLSRGTDREVGHLYVMSNGTDATIVGENGSLGSTGVTFSTIQVGDYIQLWYTTDSTGDDAIFRYKNSTILSS